MGYFAEDDATKGTALAQGLAPSQYQGASGEVILLGSDILRDAPQLLVDYYKAWKLPPTFLSKLLALGFNQSAQGPIIGHYEEPRPTHTFTVGSVITPAGGAGQVIVVAVAAADMHTFTDGAGTARTGSRPRARETYMFADRNEYRVESKNEAVNPHQLTLKPVRASVNANTNVVAGAAAFCVSPIQGENMGGMQPLDQRYLKYTNKMAIISDINFGSGTYQTTESPFQAVKGKKGFFSMVGAEALDIRHEQLKSRRMVFGTPFDNITDSSNKLGTVKVEGTEGLRYFAETYGLDDVYNDINSYSINDLYSISAYYKEHWSGSTEIMNMQGYKLYNQCEKLLKDYLDNTYVNYVGDKYMGSWLKQSGKSADDMFVAFGFTGVKLGGFNQIFTSLHELDDIQGAGAAGFNFNQYGISCPLGSFTDGMSNKQVPLLGYQYRAKDGYSRENELWNTGGAGPIQKTSEFDEMNTYVRSEIGTHFALGELFVQQRPLL